MRPSPRRHTLAILRNIISLTQKEMAELADCSTATIQAIELGKLQLSERLAGLIALRTGVALSWLLDNKLDVPPFRNSIGDSKQPYTLKVYEEARAFSVPKVPAFEVLQPHISYQTSIHRLAVLLIKAVKKKKAQLCAYKIARVLDELDKEFGVGDDELEAFEILTGKYLERPKREQRSPGTAPYAVFAEEIQKLTPQFKGWKSITFPLRFASTPDGLMIPASDELIEELKNDGSYTAVTPPQKSQRAPKKGRSP